MHVNYCLKLIGHTVSRIVRADEVPEVYGSGHVGGHIRPHFVSCLGNYHCSPGGISTTAFDPYPAPMLYYTL